MLILSDADVRAAMTMADYVDAVEAGYREAAVGRAPYAPRLNLWTGEGRRSLKGLLGALPELDAMCVMAYSGGFPRPDGRRDRLQKVFVHYSARDGACLALMAGETLSWMRTGAVAAVAARALARPDASVVAIIGAGRQAVSQLLGLCAVRPVREVRVYSRSAEGRAAFAERMARETGARVEPVESARAAVAGAHIVVTATTSRQPVLEGAWLEPGQHLTAMGAHYEDARELDTEAVRRSLVVVDAREQAMGEKGEILIPLREGAIEEGHIQAELADVLAGRHPGRTAPEQITLFCSGGTGIEDTAAAAWAYRRARELGLGTDLPLQ